MQNVDSILHQLMDIFGCRNKSKPDKKYIIFFGVQKRATGQWFLVNAERRIKKNQKIFI